MIKPAIWMKTIAPRIIFISATTLPGMIATWWEAECHLLQDENDL